MRIQLKTPYKGYTPAFDSSSKDKLIWYKTPKSEYTKDGYSPTAPFSESKATLAASILIVFAGIWSRYINQRKPKYEPIGIYHDLGQTAFIILFSLAIIAGIVCFIISIHLRDKEEVLKVGIDQSIEFYKQAPTNSPLKQKRMIHRLWAVPFAFVSIIFVYWALFQTSDMPRTIKTTYSEGIILAMALLGTALLVNAILYSTAAILSRQYIKHKFDIKSSKN